MNKRWVDVAAGVILSPDKRQVLLALRQANQHQGNLWEFPGGKLELGEAADAALVRELAEEIDIHATGLDELIVIEHDYPDKSVRLHVYVVNAFTGDPRGVEGQELRWVAVAELDTVEFPQANRSIVDALKCLDLPQ